MHLCRELVQSPICPGESMSNLLQTMGAPTLPGVQGPWGSSLAGMSGPKGKSDHHHPASGMGFTYSPVSIQGLGAGGGGSAGDIRKVAPETSCLRPSEIGHMARRGNLPKVTCSHVWQSQFWTWVWAGSGAPSYPCISIPLSVVVCVWKKSLEARAPK